MGSRRGDWSLYLLLRTLLPLCLLPLCMMPLWGLGHLRAVGGWGRLAVHFRSASEAICVGLLCPCLQQLRLLLLRLRLLRLLLLLLLLLLLRLLLLLLLL